MDTATASTSAAAPAAGTILALDLGKYKSVACAYSGDPDAARFESLTTDRDHLRRLFAKHRPAVVVILFSPRFWIAGQGLGDLADAGPHH